VAAGVACVWGVCSAGAAAAGPGAAAFPCGVGPVEGEGEGCLVSSRSVRLSTLLSAHLLPLSVRKLAKSALWSEVCAVDCCIPWSFKSEKGGKTAHC
jgi:hypothetical protein